MSEDKYNFKITETTDEVAKINCVMKCCSDSQFVILLDS